MKFIKIYKKITTRINLHGIDCRLNYIFCEGNDIGLGMLEFFLTGDLKGNSTTYINWLRNAEEEDSIGGNSIALIKDKDKIEIRNSWFEAGDETQIAEEQNLKFTTNTEQLINIIESWISLVSDYPLYENDNKLPDSILITENSLHVVNLEAIAIDDIRFSAQIEDYKQPNASIEKSKLFEQYYKVRSNNTILYKVGLTLTTYLERKPIMVEWLKNFENQNLFYNSMVIFYKQGDIIFIHNYYDQQEKKWFHEFSISIENFIKLLDEWESLIARGVEKVNLKFENERVVLSSSN